MTTPRAFIVRHGETEWSLSGRHTGTTELPLTANGERRILATGKALVGNDRLIVPSKLAHIYVSPRKRAQRTLELLQLGCKDKLPWQNERGHGDDDVRTGAAVQITDDIREWDYGEYEGLTSPQIRDRRLKETGSAGWDIWTDGCPGGELIADIRSRFHQPAIEAPLDRAPPPPDVLLVAHGHILRAFAMRWIGKRLEDNPSLLLEAGGVGTLSYEHRRLEEPAILLGGAFMVEAVEDGNNDPGKRKTS
ncbi:MAG: hypothetical protein M1826_003183 [Phylliscum demangeonii]|nr:MAG: hypothetical protein M1826_003183 [Phylliscum demangeonii]